MFSGSFALQGLTEVVCLYFQVRRSGNQVVFLLSNKETDWYYNRQNMPLEREMASLKFLPYKPRTIELKKGNNSYGFCLRMEQNGKGKNQATGSHSTALAFRFALSVIHSQPSMHQWAMDTTYQAAKMHGSSMLYTKS